MRRVEFYILGGPVQIYEGELLEAIMEEVANNLLGNLKGIKYAK